MTTRSGIHIEIIGPVGSGKSQTAALIGEYLKSIGFEVLHCNDKVVVEKYKENLEATLELRALQPLAVTISSLRREYRERLSEEVVVDSNTPW